MVASAGAALRARFPIGPGAIAAEPATAAPCSPNRFDNSSTASTSRRMPLELITPISNLSSTSLEASRRATLAHVNG
jgi:hypothetical protein